MKRKLILGLLILTLIAVPLSATACEEEVTPPGEEEEEEEPPAEEEEEEVVGDWWDKFGEPQYGGKITIVTSGYAPNFDVSSFVGGDVEFWYEALFEPSWTLNRETWSFQGSFVPDQYWEGNLAESWEQTDPTTITVHLRQGVLWQDKPPVNGREFTAYDIVEHYDRILGTGSGYTEVNPMYAGMLYNWEKVTATDKYTVVFKFKTPCAGTAFQSISGRITYNIFEAPEVVEEQGGSITDWTKAIGTGPWILTDFVANNSATCVKNPTYWGTDPRHPENQVPYADELVLLVIPDMSAKLASLRSGQIDCIADVDWQLAQSLLDTNPEMRSTMISGGASGVTFRVDKAPFTDIRVRKALQLTINRPLIAQTYYGGAASETPAGIITPAYTGYAFDYSDWPQELKDEYSYNLDLARQLLAEAAVDGVFELNEYGGFDTNVVAPTMNIDLELLELIKSCFMEIGVDMTINTMDWTSYSNYTWSMTHDQMCCFLGSLYTQEPTRVIDQFYSQGQWTTIGIADASYDAIRDQFWAASSSADVAQAMREADKYVIQQHWIVLAPEYYNYTLWQPYLRGYSGEDLIWGAGITYARLWIDQSLK